MTTTTDFTRRALLTAGVAGLALSVFGRFSPAGATTEGNFEVTLSEAEWRKTALTKQQSPCLAARRTTETRLHQSAFFFFFFCFFFNDEKRKPCTIAPASDLNLLLSSGNQKKI